MSNLIPDDIRQAFEFLKERHSGKCSVTYVDLLVQDWPDWVQIEAIEKNVANGILRWIAQHPDDTRRALVRAMFASIHTTLGWSDFKARLWLAMDAENWLQRWDCFNSEGSLWQAALLHVYHTFNLYFYPSEYER